MAPFANQLDLSISHDIIVPQRNGREHKLRFSFNIDNFLNLLNRNWGVSYSQYLGTNGQQYQFLSVTQKPTAANDYTLQYKMTNGLKDIYGNDIALQPKNTPYPGSFGTMQFVKKYIFYAAHPASKHDGAPHQSPPFVVVSLRDQDSAAGSLSSSSPMASRSVSLGNAPVAICGIPRAGMKSSVGTERTPKAAASSCSQSMSTL